jgi:hypothetical protein
MSDPIASMSTELAPGTPSPIGEITVIAYGWGQGKSEIRVDWPTSLERTDAAGQEKFLRQAISELTAIIPSLPG